MTPAALRDRPSVAIGDSIRFRLSIGQHPVLSAYRDELAGLGRTKRGAQLERDLLASRRYRKRVADRYRGRDANCSFPPFDFDPGSQPAGGAVTPIRRRATAKLPRLRLKFDIGIDSDSELIRYLEEALSLPARECHRLLTGDLIIAKMMRDGALRAYAGDKAPANLEPGLPAPPPVVREATVTEPEDPAPPPVATSDRARSLAKRLIACAGVSDGDLKLASTPTE